MAGGDLQHALLLEELTALLGNERFVQLLKQLRTQAASHSLFEYNVEHPSNGE
jgi:mannitol/fructose-specific phosphotransferase system IIA component (Ntr-type)